MRSGLLNWHCFLLAAIAVFITQQVSAVAVAMDRHIDNSHNVLTDYDVAYAPGYTDEDSYYDMIDEDQKVATDNSEKRAARINIFRRGCIPRGGACDNRPNDCCYNSSCRCNLWGSNCRCQRMGLFQKWG